MIYLDYAANYPAKVEVLDYLKETELKYFGNANSSHSLGHLALEFVNSLNDSILELLNLDKNLYEIVHVSSATEANNLAIKGIVKSYSSFGNKVLVSEMEHNSINGTLGFLKDQGLDVDFIKTSNGTIDILDLKEKMTKDTILVIVSAIDSELGTKEPIDEIISILKDYPNCHFLCDVTQAISKYQLPLNEMELFSFTPHKFGGITGTGLLIKRKSTILTPLIHGGNSLSIYRSGSISVGLIASSYMAIKLMISSFNERIKKIKELSAYFLNQIKDIKKLKLNSVENLFIFNLSMEQVRGSEMVRLLDEFGIYVSQKSACSIKNTPSKIVMAVYKNKARALSSFRVSISENTTKEELDEFFNVLRRISDGTL